MAYGILEQGPVGTAMGSKVQLDKVELLDSAGRPLSSQSKFHTITEELEKKSFNRMTFSCNSLRLYTEDHLWLYPTLNGDNTFYCGLTGMWYTIRGSGYQLFDSMSIYHWIVEFPYGETLMDDRGYIEYCDRLWESQEEWRKSSKQYFEELHNRKRFISNI